MKLYFTLEIDTLVQIPGSCVESNLDFNELGNSNPT